MENILQCLTINYDFFLKLRRNIQWEENKLCILHDKKRIKQRYDNLVINFGNSFGTYEDIIKKISNGDVFCILLRIL